jgi:hypothetical protein
MMACTFRTATGKAQRIKADPHRLDNQPRARPITLAPMPWDAGKR